MSYNFLKNETLGKDNNPVIMRWAKELVRSETYIKKQ